MRRTVLFLLAVAFLSCSQQPAVDPEVARWEQQAQRVTIVRDDWGIPHVQAKTDADAVFGVLYAQAEDDFNRVETNYLNAMGMLAEAEGESALYRDLRMKLFIAPEKLKAQYEASPAWLKALMNAFADGLNYYLYKHPQVKPRAIERFEPWMALSFTEGSIGGDIESISLAGLEAFYGKGQGGTTTTGAADQPAGEGEPGGSNGIAIAPSNTVDKHALLLINPHTSFFFRAEAQMTSEEGLNAYGAITWGQFFIYQGFNERAGWMHTSSGVDNIDEFLETVVNRDGRYYYRYGAEERPVETSTVTVPYKTGTGMAQKTFTVYRTHRGPIVREEGGKWVSVSLMHKPIDALIQSYSRTKATGYESFRKTMELHTNSSNNTIYADADGTIAYFHSNFIPKRDTRFDWRRPVDGSDPATEWGPVLSVDETPLVVNPASGWLYNTNNWPWSAAGPSSPRQADYPPYVENGTENARGLHAIRLLKDKKDFTLESLRAAAYDSYLPWFEKTVPALVRAWDRAGAGSPLKASLAEQVALLRKWDLRWSVDSVPTSLAHFWGEEIMRQAGGPARSAGMAVEDYVAAKAAPEMLLKALAAASGKLEADFGTWKTAWGEINRFQRLTGDIVHPFRDDGPSIPVGFTSARWGSLASFAARPYKNSKKIYGTSGNSFVAVVEFGDRVRARAITAGGQSGDPASPHFNDQALRYSTGDLREVYFYPDQLKAHTERTYRPGS
ncbi:MAG: acylase [Vicinamibacterales bacterium]